MQITATKKSSHMYILFLYSSIYDTWIIYSQPLFFFFTLTNLPFDSGILIFLCISWKCYGSSGGSKEANMSGCEFHNAWRPVKSLGQEQGHHRQHPKAKDRPQIGIECHEKKIST